MMGWDGRPRVGEIDVKAQLAEFAVIIVHVWMLMWFVATAAIGIRVGVTVARMKALVQVDLLGWLISGPFIGQLFGVAWAVSTVCILGPIMYAVTASLYDLWEAADVNLRN